jgi:hypothetical protein
MALSAGVTAVAWAMAAQNLVHFVALWALDMRVQTTPVGNVAAVAPKVPGLAGRGT